MTGIWWIIILVATVLLCVLVEWTEIARIAVALSGLIVIISVEWWGKWLPALGGGTCSFGTFLFCLFVSIIIGVLDSLVIRFIYLVVCSFFSD